MKKFYILIVAVFLSSQLFSQQRISFEAGLRYRVTPIYINKIPELIIDRRQFLMQQDAHISGAALSGGINFPISKKLYFSYTGYLRYDEFFAEIDSVSKINKYINKVFFDNSFHALFQVVTKEKYNLQVGLGISVNNLNSNYSYNYYEYNQAGVLERYTNADNFIFTTLDMPIKFEFKRNWIITLIGSVTAKTRFFIIPNDFILIDLGIRYKLRLKDKNGD